MKSIKVICIVLVACCAALSAARAQRPATGQPGVGTGTSQPLTPSSPNMPIFNVYRGGEVQIDVNLWGYVNSPGHYRVPGSTSLVELLSFAGGPSAQARLVDIRIVHADTAQEKRVETYNLEAYRDNGDLAQNPLLVPGDTIIVSGRALDVFFQAIGIITNIMVIITALINFISFTTK
ncbi:MAG: SLBB domain-containing protein [Bacteroidota bacterium]|nr:SLBB domain-containing protein [Bacteroidota bacterium]MDP4233773.1 SLBB domain-containing protein [Bacteroidota bacterium]MDP4242412.1 SLBB domain-containing protein [Bacteroidota bacterium]MDP4287534.1 SLBB domain-containing protein [Bacteroidota bacterium]